MDMIETVQESGVTKLDLNSKPYVGYYGKFIKISDQIPTKTKEKILQDLSHDRRTLQYDQIKEEINMDPTVSDDEIRTMINQIASIKNSDIIIREVKMVKIEGGQLRPEIKDKFIHSPQIESIRGGEMCAL